MKKIISATGLLISALLLGLIIPIQAEAQTQRIILAGYKQKPPVATSGSGMAIVKLKGDTLTVEGDFEDLTNRFSGAYVMVNLPRGGSNQLYELDVELNEEQTGGVLKAKNNKFELSPAVKELLQEGNLFIIISTFEYKNGELRGNIEAMK